MGNVKDWAGEIDRLKNRSGKCEGPGGGGRRGKKLEWEIQRIGAREGGPTVV